MIFTTADKIAVAKVFYEKHFQFKAGVTTPWTKAEESAAIDSMKNWKDANQANFLSTLATDAPAFSGTSTGQQKALLFCYVVLRDAGLI